MGWITGSTNGSHVGVYESSGLLTYKDAGGVPYCNCQDAKDFDVDIMLTGGDSSECRDIEITNENKSCDNEWLVTWFSGSSYSKILDDAAKEILVVKNIDDCDKVITLNNYDYEDRGFINNYRLYVNSTTINTFGYTDCGIPRLISSTANTCTNKYENLNNQNIHKIKYKPIDEKIPTNFLTNSSALTEIYFPARFDDEKFKNTITISDGAFSGNTALSAVTFSKVETIGISAFSGCTNLQLVDWAYCIYNGYEGQEGSRDLSRLKTISAKAFSDCSFNGINLSFPESLERIGASAFTSCHFTGVTIGSGVTSIGTSAFANCSGLTSVTVRATTPPTLGSSAFDNNASGRKIYVPSDSVDAYKTASGWSNYANDIQAIQ